MHKVEPMTPRQYALISGFSGTAIATVKRYPNVQPISKERIEDGARKAGLLEELIASVADKQ